MQTALLSLNEPVIKPRPKFFLCIRDKPEDEGQEVPLAAQSLHAAKMEARGHQQWTGPATRRINLYENHPTYQSYVAALIGPAEEWDHLH